MAPAARSPAIPCAGLSVSVPVISSQNCPELIVRRILRDFAELATRATLGAFASTKIRSIGPPAWFGDSAHVTPLSRETQILPSEEPAYAVSPAAPYAVTVAFRAFESAV